MSDIHFMCDMLHNLTAALLSCSCHSRCHSHSVASICGLDHTFQERILDLPWQQIHSPNVSVLALCEAVHAFSLVT